MPDTPDHAYDPDAATIPVQGPRPTLSGQNAPDLPLPEELTGLLPHGNYAVEGFLGAGGMGAVYKGMQVRLKRPVAIKIMRRDMGRDHDFEARFEREAQAMAKLNHPNIVSVIDYGEAGPDYLYIVMELIDGADLMDVIRGGQMTQEMALTLLPQICDALQFAHDHGIVHRDIKPSNIMVTCDGRVKMADFGLAKHFDAESTLHTKTGTGMGTPDYAAPEQFDPTAHIDHRADIYALGVMIYQMITGQLPRGAWKAPSQRAEVDTHWDDIVSRAMQNDPADRYQHASEIKTDVSGISLVQKGSADTPVRPPSQGGDAAKIQAAGKLLSREANARAPVKSRAPLLFGVAVGAAVLALGAFFAFKPKPSGPQTSGSGTSATRAAEQPQTKEVTPGKTINLLALVDVKRDALMEPWTLENGALRSPQGISRKEEGPVTHQTLVFPTPHPPGNYDLRYRLTRNTKGLAVAFAFVRSGSVIDLRMDGGHGLALMPTRKSREGKDNREKLWLPPCETHEVLIEVREDRVRVSVDGAVELDQEGTLPEDRRPNDAFYPSDKVQMPFIGIGVCGGDITVHSAELREVDKNSRQDAISTTAAPSLHLADSIQTFAGHRYQLVPGAVTWDEAKAMAAGMGGHLATVTSQSENAWIYATFGSRLDTAQRASSIWLGGMAEASGQPWKWVTSEPFTFTGWTKDEPDYASTKGQPVQGPFGISLKNHGQLGWFDDPVDRKNANVGFIVEWDK